MSRVPPKPSGSTVKTLSDGKTQVSNKANRVLGAFAQSTPKAPPKPSPYQKTPAAIGTSHYQKTPASISSPSKASTAKPPKAPPSAPAASNKPAPSGRTVGMSTHWQTSTKAGKVLGSHPAFPMKGELLKFPKKK